MKVWVAHERAEQLMGGAPAGVEVVVWDGRRPPPKPFGDVEFFVPPTWNKAACLELLPELTGLRTIQLLSAGADWIIPSVPSGVILCDAKGVHDPAVSEWAMTAILSSLRRFPVFLRQQVNGGSGQQSTDTLYGKTVVIVGHGSIGRALAIKLRAFDAVSIGVAHAARPGVTSVTDVHSLLPRADIVVLLLPLTDQTVRLVDRRFLAAMKDGALLVNASRGAVVDTTALVDEVAAGRLMAALDVTDPDPLPGDHPLRTLQGVLITPHVASFTPTWLPRIYALVGDQLTRLQNGEPLLNRVVDSY